MAHQVSGASISVDGAPVVTMRTGLTISTSTSTLAPTCPSHKCWKPDSYSDRRRAAHLPQYASFVKRSGSTALHAYLPIVCGPTQKEVWVFARACAREVSVRYPALVTTHYRVAKRPAGRLLSDYSQNAWDRTLARLLSEAEAGGDRLNSCDVGRD